MALNAGEIALFSTGIFLATTGAVLVSARLPLSAQPPARRGVASILLVAAVAATALALTGVSIAFAWGRLSLPVGVVAGGLAFVAAPPVLQFLPARLVDTGLGLGGQAMLALATILALSAHS